MNLSQKVAKMEQTVSWYKILELVVKSTWLRVLLQGLFLSLFVV